MQCFVGRQESPPQARPRSAQPCLHSEVVRSRVTDRLTDAGNIYHNSPSLMRSMQPNTEYLKKKSFITYPDIIQKILYALENVTKLLKLLQ